MAEHSRFFDSLNPLEPDRTYTAEEFTSYFRALITTGIMKGAGNMLKVETSGSNMNTTVDTGTAFLIGRQYENDSKLSLTHEIETLGRSRIDRVVLRLVLDMDARYIRAFVKKGVAGTAPIAPPLERTGNVYEISLAQVKVIGGQTYINKNGVTDERGNPNVCPWSGSKILPNFDDSALEELVHNVDGLVNLPTPAEVVYSSGWSRVTSALTLKYYKDRSGVVHLKGMAQRSGSTSMNVTTLPVGYRPKVRTEGYAYSSTGGLSYVRVETTGVVQVITENNLAVLLVNIDLTFRTD